MKIVKQYIKDGMQVTEYDNGYIVKVPAQTVVPPNENVPVPPTFEQRLKEAEEKQTLMQAALDDLILGGAL